MIPKHRIEHDQQFAGARDVRQLLALPTLQQTAIEGRQHRIAAAGTEHRHVQRSAHRCAAAPDHAPALKRPALMRMRRDSDERGDLTPPELPQFWNLGHQAARQLGAHAGNLLQQRQLFLLRGGMLDGLFYLLLEFRQRPLESPDARHDALLHHLARAQAPIALRHQHLDQLPPPAHQSLSSTSASGRNWVNTSLSLRSIECPNCASTNASWRSVLASRPRLRANSRTWR